MDKMVYESPEFNVFPIILTEDVIMSSPIDPIGGEDEGRTGDEGGDDDNW